MDLQVADFVEQIKTCSTAEQTARCFIAFGERQGACTATTFFGTDSGRQFVSNLPPSYYEEVYDWDNIYRCHITSSVRAGTPYTFFGVDICTNNPNATAVGMALNRTDLEHLGRRCGVVFAMPDRNGQYSGAGMGFGFEDKGDLFLKLMKESCAGFGVVAFAAFSRMALLQNKPFVASMLSKRQREILQLLAAGYKVKAIATRLGITSSAVNLYLFNCKKKLNVKTREQALAQALVHGWIEI